MIFHLIHFLLLFFLVFSSPLYAVIEEGNLIYVFLGGFIAVCAFILPGVSGSFILLVLGLYEVMISSITQLDLVFLGTLFAGCLSGLLLFIRLLKRAYEEYREILMAFFYFLVLFAIPLIWKDGAWSISYPDPSLGIALPVIGFLIGSGIILLLQKTLLNFILLILPKFLTMSIYLKHNSFIVYLMMKRLQMY